MKIKNNSQIKIKIEDDKVKSRNLINKFLKTEILERKPILSYIAPSFDSSI